MSESVRQHLPVIIVVTLVGIATCYLALSRVLGGVNGLDVDAFNNYVFLIPCAIMLVGSLVIVLTAHSIGRQLYVVVVAICLVLGIVVMVLSAVWQSDAAISAALLANSEAGTEMVPITDSPILVLRDIAAFFVVPTVGCIAGAWLGSRIHPMSSETQPKSSKGKSKSKSKSKKAQ